MNGNKIIKYILNLSAKPQIKKVTKTHKIKKKFMNRCKKARIKRS